MTILAPTPTLTAVTAAIAAISHNEHIPQAQLLELLYAVETELSHTAVLLHTAVVAERFLNNPTAPMWRAELRTAVAQVRAKGLLP